MKIEEKIAELTKQKQQMEAQANNIQQNLNVLQQQLANLNREYLIILGELKAYENMKTQEKPKEDDKSKTE